MICEEMIMNPYVQRGCQKLEEDRKMHFDYTINQASYVRAVSAILDGWVCESVMANKAL